MLSILKMIIAPLALGFSIRRFLPHVAGKLVRLLPPLAPAAPPPFLVKLVQDRDLWRFRFDATKPIRMLLQSVDRSFPAWDDVAQRLETDLEGAVRTGAAIQRFYDARVDEMAAAATVQTFQGHEGVPVAHVPYAFVSDVCHRLLQLHPAAPFAAACVVAHGGTTYSLRSADDRIDVSEIAKANGGGGHRNAARFRVEAAHG